MKTMKKEETHQWVFKSRFRRHAFGWKSQPAITRVRQAVAEIRKVGKTKPILAAEGAILFFERVSPAIEQVDGRMTATTMDTVVTTITVFTNDDSAVPRASSSDRISRMASAGTFMIPCTPVAAITSKGEWLHW